MFNLNKAIRFRFTLYLLTCVCLIFATHSIAQEAEQLDPQRTYARLIPGFAGLYFEEEQAIISLTSEGDEALAYDRLRETLQTKNIEPDLIEFRRVEHDYQTLALWHDRLIGIIPPDLPFLFIDVDEVANKLVVGVQYDTVTDRLVALADDVGMPFDAMEISVEEPLQPYVRFSSQIRPILGGVRISKEAQLGGPFCTLGFLANREAFDHRLSAIINSHCTHEKGRVDSSEFGQPTLTSPIGIEVDDPAFFASRGTIFPTGPCPPFAKCRYSDAARIVLRSDVVGRSLAGIARPPRRHQQGSGIVADFEINASFRIVGENHQIFSGIRVQKVGVSTAWTEGAVVRSCVTEKIAGPDRFNFLICQSRVLGYGGPGDSGSPVFEITNINASEVALSGLLVGGREDAGTYTFSPISNIELELGQLITHTDVSHPDNQMPDLVPVNPSPNQVPFGLCQTDDYGNRIITIRNRSRFHVPIATTTRIFYGGADHVDLVTPPIKAFEEVTLSTPVHERCKESDCSFTVYADANLELDERASGETDQHETNNIMRGRCLN